MRGIKVEICVNSNDELAVDKAVRAAYVGGAATVELCSAMHLDGLTPPQRHIAVARQAFRRPGGLMVMIRPRGGDFSYTSDELEGMLRQIEAAYKSGADGVVLGVLDAKGRRIAVQALQPLLRAARMYGLTTTFHRAFDATPDPDQALEALIALGMQRVLTCGIPWGQPGSALDGIERITRTIRRARSRIEVVVGGGINPANAARIVERLPLDEGPLAIHAYSGAQVNGVTTATAVRALVQAVQRRRF